MCINSFSAIMAFNLESAKKADQKSNHLIFGFVREAQQLLPVETYYNIPELISHICLVYYFLMDFFDPNLMHPSIEYADKDNKHCVIKKVMKWGSAYLSNVVSSGKHHWKFKIEGKGAPEIGIAADEDAQIVLDNMWFTQGGKGYSYITSHANLTDDNGDQDYGTAYGRECKAGDVIDMFVDFEANTIRYHVNGKDYGIAFKNIKPGKYRAATAMGTTIGNKLRLLEYEQI